MSSDFVRYSPEIETFDPKRSEYMTRLLDYWKTKVRESPDAIGAVWPQAVTQTCIVHLLRNSFRYASRRD
jgi:mutator family transposase